MAVIILSEIDFPYAIIWELSIAHMSCMEMINHSTSSPPHLMPSRSGTVVTAHDYT